MQLRPSKASYRSWQTQFDKQMQLEEAKHQARDAGLIVKDILSCSLNSCYIGQGSTIGVTKGDIRSLDNGSYGGGGCPKIRCTFLGVPIIGMIVWRGLY